MTLTGPVDDDRARTLAPILERLCAPACAEPLVVDAVSLLLEPEAGADFELRTRYQMRAPVMSASSGRRSY